ncbi:MULTISPECIES: hypothetical protein [Hydrotalea]|jgi:hypothetical protein|uniref:Uncharacterized protein n=1 Tax=Hydrotalea sandarakina TaxID=1004304 RepID=A0A2W7RKH6_9BACT|nr:MULTISPECIES: hypothetical protein [Hydrotalea]PZX59486.1 hypothetical protein LX80_02733 [Hydrotalea sandarakina]
MKAFLLVTFPKRKYPVERLLRNTSSIPDKPMPGDALSSRQTFNHFKI